MHCLNFINIEWKKCGTILARIVAQMQKKYGIPRGKKDSNINTVE